MSDFRKLESKSKSVATNQSVTEYDFQITCSKLHTQKQKITQETIDTKCNRATVHVQH